MPIQGYHLDPSTGACGAVVTRCCSHLGKHSCSTVGPTQSTPKMGSSVLRSSSALSLPELRSRPRNLRRPRQLDRLDRGEAGLGRRRDAWPLLRPSRTLKRRQPAARPRILHTRRHDQAERARCRGLVRAACEGRLLPQQVHQTGVKACRRCAVVGEPDTAAEEPSAVASQGRPPGSPSGGPCPF